MPTLKALGAVEILDSRGNPTLQVTATLEGGEVGVAAVPSGASTGSHEALELRDGDAKRYGGKGVLRALSNVTGPLASAMVGKQVDQLRNVDALLIAADGTPNKAALGANAILGVSLATAHALAAHQRRPLYDVLAEQYDFPKPGTTFPRFFCNVVNGGLHAASTGLSFQEYMLLPRTTDVPKQLQMCAEVFHTLGTVLKAKALATMVGDEGGYAPSMRSQEEPLRLLAEAVERAGYVLGEDVEIALDPAATEFVLPDGTYRLALEQTALTADQLTALYLDWHARYHVTSVEDGLAEDDWANWPAHTAALDKAGMLAIGDDLFVTNVTRLQRGVDEKVANAILVKVNQIGTLTEAMDAIKLAQSAGYKVVVSHRSGETCDATIADIAVATGADGLKAGSMSRGERLAKYNRLLAIWQATHA